MADPNADCVPTDDSWSCPDCGCIESVESAFCWRCGAGKPEQNDRSERDWVVMTDVRHLYETTDAQVWAQEWCRIAREIEERGDSLIDEGWMIGWMANAIETGRSAGLASRASRSLSDESSGATELGECVVLPRTALLEFLGAVALPPWRDEHGEWIGGNIDCAPIAGRIAEWIRVHDLAQVILHDPDLLDDPDPVRTCPVCGTEYRGWPCPNGDEDESLPEETP